MPRNHEHAQQQAVPLNIVVAHRLEADPLIKLLQLKPDSVRPFPSWRNEAGISLVISGPGKLAAAAASGFIGASKSGAQQQLQAAEGWLNIGIAGHGAAAIGQGFLAHKITDLNTGVCAYPVPLLSGYRGTALVTVDQPELTYPEPVAYDMEASGFWAAASRFVTTELIQVYKIVSDNPNHSSEQVTPALVRRLLAEQLECLQKLLVDLSSLVAEYNEVYRLPPAYARLEQAVKLSVTQLSQLKRLCQRGVALGLEAELETFAAQRHSSSRQMLASLLAMLEPEVGA
jgi:adenosylhomocysteine nucleosidase